MKSRSLKAVAMMAMACLLAVPVWPAPAQGCPKRRAVSPRSPKPVYLIAAPIAHKNLAIYPIQGPRTLPDTKFLVLAEAMEQEKIIVHETGTVGELEIENVSNDTEIYIQSGDIVKGGKQDRLIACDILLPPRSGKKPAPSLCVESGRWQKRNAEDDQRFHGSQFQAATSGIRLGAQLGGQFGQLGTGQLGQMNPPQPSGTGQFGQFGQLGQLGGAQIGQFGQLGGGQLGQPGGQGAIWKEVESAQKKLARKLGKSAASEDSPTSLQLTLENKKLQELMKPYLDELEKAPDGRRDVVGFAYAINGVVVGADYYGSSTLFEKLWPRLLRAAVVEAVADEDETKRYASPRVERVIDFLVDADFGPKGEEVMIHERMKGFMREGRRALLFESRDIKANDVLLHRNYLLKPEPVTPEP